MLISKELLPRLQDHLLSSNWNEPNIGIVHLGLGNFHRAHQALYTEEAIIHGGGDWGICGVTLQGSTRKKDLLIAQDNLYTVLEVNNRESRARVIRVLKEVLAMPHDLDSLKSRLQNPGVKIVSLTITEKGYCRDGSSGDVDASNPLIVHDLQTPSSPMTAPGILLAGLWLRKQNSIPAFTVLSCDNLSNNGKALRQVVLSMADMLEKVHALYLGFSRWIAEHASFPSTMVDRIVPASTEDDIRSVETILHATDLLPVPCEPFRQWVIEDSFVGGRPAWDDVGAQLVQSVMPFEHAKLRLLNGAHSTMAYLGLLAGFSTVDEVVVSEPFQRLIRRTMSTEVLPTLTDTPSEFDLERYCDALMVRFSNSALRHRLSQIAKDGSMKIPQRLVGPINDLVTQRKDFKLLALALAGWIKYLRDAPDNSKVYIIDDPLAEKLAAAVHHRTDDHAYNLEPLFQMTELFPPELAEQTQFQDSVLHALRSLDAGVVESITKNVRL